MTRFLLDISYFFVVVLAVALIKLYDILLLLSSAIFSYLD